MEEELEDWSSLHSQLLFPPCEPSNRQREYELERHLALMDGPPRTPGRKLTDMDLGNLTIEHFPSQETNDDCFLLMEDEKCPDDNFFDIGIEATDLGSLLQQFEQTEAALLMSPDNSVTATCNSKCKGSSLQLPDPEALAKKITPIKRKSAILLEPQAMPTKRLRSKEVVLTMADRECVSLPGSRTSSPVPTPHNGLSIICSADQGFDYLIMDHDYCSNSEQVSSRVRSAASSPRNDSKRLSAEERKAVYKQKYRIRKKVRKTPPMSRNKAAFLEQEPLNLINKLPDYIQPMPEVVPITKSVPSQEKTERKSSETAQVDSQEKKDPIVEQEKPTFFDKIPDYFISKHMFQEISKVQEEEARKKEEEEMAKREEDQKREEDAKKTKNKDLAKEHHRNRHSSQHPEIDKMRNRQHAKTSVCESNANSSKLDAMKASAVSEVLIETSKELNSEIKIEPKEKTEICNKECPEEKYDPIDRKGELESRTGRSRRKSTSSERRSRSRSISLSSRSRSRSKSSFRSRSRSSSLSWSSRSRERRRRNSRNSRGSPSSVSSCSSSRSRSRSRLGSISRPCSRSRSFSRSRSHSRARSYRGRRRRHSTYSSASSSRSRSRSPIKSRHWRPRSRSGSRLRRSRSRSHYSRRSHSQDSDRRHRRDSHRHRSRSRSRRRMRSISIERQEESRKQQLKEQDEQWADRRVVYIGRIPYGTTRGIIRRRFIKHGEIERITLHFRDVGDNYAFVTYVYKCDAYAAVEGAKTDVEEPQYDICFGGRRQFCKASYADLDSMGQEEMALEYGYDQAPTCTGNHSNNAMETDFDRMLREAMKKTKRYILDSASYHVLWQG